MMNCTHRLRLFDCFLSFAAEFPIGQCTLIAPNVNYPEWGFSWQYHDYYTIERLNDSLLMLSDYGIDECRYLAQNILRKYREHEQSHTPTDPELPRA